jgi:inorganic pyrophosphatase
MKLKAFIEVDGGTDQRPKYNEETLEYIKTITVYKPYPYAYGFLLDTKSGDGDHLDCYVITSTHLKSGEILEVEAIGMVECVEDGEEDHKILVRLVDEEEAVVDAHVEENIRDFGEHYFDNRPEKKLETGRFLGVDAAVELIEKCRMNNVVYSVVKSVEEIEILSGKESFHYIFDDELLHLLQRNFALKDSLYILAKHTDKFSGFCSMDRDWREENYFFIREIVVDSSFQKCHVGSTMFEKCIDHAKNCGAMGIVTETAFDNIPMQKLCEKFGFQKWNNEEWKDGVTYKLVF